MSGHVLVSHCFAYMVIICIKLGSVYLPMLTIFTLNHISYRNNSTLLQQHPPNAIIPLILSGKGLLTLRVRVRVRVRVKLHFKLVRYETL